MAHPITLPETSSRILNGLHADSLRLTCGRTDISLFLQNYIDLEDPDMHSLVMHQILLGWQEGYLSLTSSYGPVIWVGNWFDPAHMEASTTLYDGPPETRLRLKLPARQILHEGPETWQRIFEHDAPTCVRRLLEAICTALDGEDAVIRARVTSISSRRRVAIHSALHRPRRMSTMSHRLKPCTSIHAPRPLHGREYGE